MNEEEEDLSNSIQSHNSRLYAKIKDDLNTRMEWEKRQDLFYKMRNHGLRRKNKPHPGCSDMHFPLIDNTIRKMLPFYFAQFATMNKVATFVAGPQVDEQLRIKTSDVETWFDYQIKEETNIEDQLIVLIDYMLQTGHGIMKNRWDIEDNAVAFDAIDPLYIIVPNYTKRLETADRLTEVMQMSLLEYKSNTSFNQDPDVISRIQRNTLDTEFEKEDSMYDREGITRGHKHQIIIWNVYERQKDGTYKVSYFSPVDPDMPIRESFTLPYTHGQLPYVDFLHEKKEKRYYDSRGIAELLAVYEMSATKMWNNKLDAMSYYNNPIYTVDGQPGGNMSNLSLRPGQIFPNNLRRVDSGAPAISWDEEIQRTQVVAEDTAQVPDFGMGNKYSGISGKSGGNRTATEVNAISQMVNTGVDLKSRLFRRSLTKLYKQCWSLYQQFSPEAKQIFVGDQMVEIPEEVMAQDYQIAPSGAPDSWDKDRKYQKALNRYQILTGNPYTNQGELTKDLMEADEVGLSQSLYVDPNEVAASEAEDEAIEIGALLLQGHPAIVKATDNHPVRINVLATKIMSMNQNQEAPTNPQAIQMIMQHMEEHFLAFAQQDSVAAQELRTQVEQMFASQLPPEEMAQEQMTEEAGDMAQMEPAIPQQPMM